MKMFMIPGIETSTRKIVMQFAEAVRDNETDLISSLLSETGVFAAQDGGLGTIQVSKETFIQWFISRLNEAVISKVDYDTCIYCSMGSPVVLFNDGQFPRIIADDSEKSMTGLMLEVSEGLIAGISFCYSFAHLENRCHFEIMSDRVKELTAQGVPLMKACNTVIERYGIKSK
jgi:hypothetical protein